MLLHGIHTHQRETWTVLIRIFLEAEAESAIIPRTPMNSAGKWPFVFRSVFKVYLRARVQRDAVMLQGLHLLWPSPA